MSEIKPCPFCGGTDVLIDEGATFRWRVARCCGCGAGAGEVRVPSLGNSHAGLWKRVITDLAMAEWNKRATPQEGGT